MTYLVIISMYEGFDSHFVLRLENGRGQILGRWQEGEQIDDKVDNGCWIKSA